MANPKGKGGRPRKGTLEFRNGQWWARLTVTIDGESVRKWYPLGTDNKTVAKRKRDRLVRELAETGAAPAADVVTAAETVDSFAGPWLEGRKARGIASADYEQRYYERVWKPAIGRLELGAVTAAHIRSVLEDAATGRIRPKPRHDDDKPGPYSRQSIVHLRATAFRLFDAAWRDELISENRVERVAVPEMDVETKVRAVLTDGEIAQLVAHPDVDAEIKLLVLLSRTIGGLRSGDLNSLDWTAFGPDFATCTFIRRKTRRKRPLPQTLEVPAPVRPFIDAWWRTKECPAAGPVFPVRRGERAGEAKKRSNMSYADRLRRELGKAGVLRHELHHETATTRPVDFHSTRRAYASALARAGVNEQTAIILTGHSDGKVHQRYVEAATIRALPERAVPALDPKAVTIFAANQNRPRRGAKPALPAPAANEGAPSQVPVLALASGDHAGLAQLVEHELPKRASEGESSGNYPGFVTDEGEREQSISRRNRAPGHFSGAKLGGAAIRPILRGFRFGDGAAATEIARGPWRAVKLPTLAVPAGTPVRVATARGLTSLAGAP